jgi:hypothetical protein
MTRARDVANNGTTDIIPLDSLAQQFDGIQYRFLPTYQSVQVLVTNPLRLFLTVNGIIQTVDFPEYVYQSPLPRYGFQIDSDGYILFSESPPAGSTFDARLMPGPATNIAYKSYPFKPTDILLGA